SLEFVLAGRSNSPLSVRANCFSMRGTRRIKRNVRHGIFQPQASQKEKDDLRSVEGERSCGRVLRRRSPVSTAHPPSASSVLIQSTSLVLGANLSRNAMIWCSRKRG